ncbi:3-deoxy-7-phosphoheptulonate synthase [Williamsia sp. SKLECPSW1]
MTVISDRSPLTDTRVRRIRALPGPRELIDELPLGPTSADRVRGHREQIADVLAGRDDRMLVVVGPCSVHDPVAALDYADRLAATAGDLADDLLVVMRVYFEKPRTTVGWKGLINDPDMDGSHDIPRGLRVARSLLLDIVERGLPIGCEFLEPTSPQYIADTVSWGAIGARTTESQVHRQLASGLSMPIGFKNGTDGDLQAAVDGVRAAAGSHTFFGVDGDGRAAVVETAGNEDCHVILRGGRNGVNSDAGSVAAASAACSTAGITDRVMVDCSHANSGKDHRRQPIVAADVAAQVAGGSRAIAGVMLESFLVEGAQSPSARPLVYGRSVTDACMDFDTTVDVLGDLAAAQRAGRSRRATT